MDIAAWLRDLGLERYEPAFRENEIDPEVLPQLTEADLVTLGLRLGPRKKLLKRSPYCARVSCRRMTSRLPRCRRRSQRPVPRPSGVS